MRPIYKMVGVAVLASTLIACNDDDDDPTQNIVELARDNGNFTTLIAALEATDLDDVLFNEDGTFTVFAPTDAAFDALEAANPGTINALLADSATLSEILLYHVVAEAEINSDDAFSAAGSKLVTANAAGDEIAVSLTGDELFINLSKVVDADVEATNGIIHAIDTVLLPPAPTDASTQTIVEIAQGDDRFDTLVTALGVADGGLVAVLSGAGPFTVFAPTDDAFDALEAANPGIIATLTTSDTATLSKILLKHVVSGAAVDSVSAFSLNGMDVDTANPEGETVTPLITSTTDGNVFSVDGAQVIVTDIVASNGIIHVIDAVITLD